MRNIPIFIILVNNAKYPWAESDFVYSISQEEKSDILDRISSEVRKAVAQAAQDTKIQLENRAALAKNASMFQVCKFCVVTTIHFVFASVWRKKFDV